jgi:N-dimethylarginine dimethylaminohydrolase
MKISSYNEYGRLREIVVGSATHANWPSECPVFQQEKELTLWKETPLPSGPVPQWIVDESNEDLAGLVKILETAGVVVHRPIETDYVAQGGMYNYCPRDRLLIVGDTVIDVAMHYPCRNQEAEALNFVTQGNCVLHMPKDGSYILDAANVCRINDTLLMLESASGNRAAAVWLQAQLPDFRVEIVNFYAGVHIDSTVSVLSDGVVLLNAARVNQNNCPAVFNGWQKIYVEDVVPQAFYQYPYASKWMALNVLSIDSKTVIVDAAQTDLIRTLEQKSYTVIPHTLRHSRTLGGGFHCVTLDTWRDHA